MPVWARKARGVLLRIPLRRTHCRFQQASHKVPSRCREAALGYVLPLPSSPPIPTTSEAPSASQDSADPPGPFSSYPGADLNVSGCNAGDCQPPDVAADVSPTQNVEFVNNLGLYVWAKPALPVTPPLPTPHVTSLASFWCTGNGANGQPLPGCGSGVPASGYALTDTQVGYDTSLARWLSSTLNFSHTLPNYVYFAVSNSSDATGGWTKWSVQVCGGSFPLGDEPLLGWSNGSGSAAVDVLCFNSNNSEGPDNLIVIPNTSIVPPAASLPAPITPPCLGMAPARDENGASSSVYLVASVVPGDPSFVEPVTCGVVSANTLPYVLEYSATSAGVAGDNGTLCPANGSCVPLSASPQFGHAATYGTVPAPQKGCTQQNCQIDANVARITSAQIRLSDFANQVFPFLTLGFQTGYQSSDNLTGSQDLWFIENVTTGSWFDFNLAGSFGWISYPTIAADNDLDIYLGSTEFNASAFPFTLWDSYSGLSPAIFEGQNVIENSQAEYTGNPADLFQRWGDYNTMVYDPNAVGPSKEGSFWEVEQITCPTLSTCSGGGDESTTWEALGDPTPLPFFVGSDNHESECTNNTCGVKATIPSGAGVQNGDLILVALVAGEATTNKPGLPDTTWTLLPASNISGAPKQISVTDSHGTNTTWLAAHIYGTSAESGSYVFTQSLSDGPEQGEFMVIYRGVSTNLSSYTAYGFKRGGNNSSFNMAAVSPPGESQLVSIAYADVGCEASESTEPNGVTFAGPSGVPDLTPETALTPPQLPWLASDTSVLQPGLIYGPYTYSVSVTGGCINTTGGFLGWEVAVPEL